MATLTITQIGQLAVNAGVQQGQPLYVCVSIALAESGGRTDAVNSNANGTKDVGEWQINDVHALMWGANDNRTDPVANAQYMFKISNSGVNWQPWTTYNTGAYNNHMQAVMSELQKANLTRGQGITPPNTLGPGMGVTGQDSNIKFPKVPNPVDAGKAIIKPLETIAKFFEILATPQGWIRILKVWIGAVLLWIGVIAMVKDTKAGAVAKKAVVAAVLKK